MEDYCESCAAPLTSEYRGPSDRYCKDCTDASGKLLPRETIQRGIAMWLSSWQHGITDQQALERAAHYMQAMPAWADQ